MAAGVIPLDEGKLHAPRWVLFLCVIVFVLGGTIVLTRSNPLARSVLAALIITSLGTIALWIAFNGDPSRFGGNALLASPEQRVSMARVAFGFGGAACYLIVAFAAARTLLRRN